MIGYILAFMAYDTVTTISKREEDKAAKEAKRKKLKQLQWRLQAPMTRGHTKKCICLLCVNRRTAATNEYNSLLAER